GSTCGECEPCRGGRERYCARQSNCGFSVDGALSTHAVVPSQHLVRVPAPLDASEAAPLCCAGWTAYAAVREAALPAGRTLAIFGLGGLGHLAIQYARHRGLRVAAVDPVEEKLDQARSLGADVAATVLRKEHGLADAALVLTANPAAIQQAFRSLQRTSTLILVGLATANFELPLVEAVLKGIRIHTSYLGTREDLEEVFRLPIRPHVTTHAIEEAPALLDRLARGQVKGRAVIRF
ncbi:MAG: alcohol dehydrogenase catalytic domain-containing protein, partial [Bryobacteraceae bacterium]